MGGHSGIRKHRNLNETEPFVIACCRNFNIRKTCKITVTFLHLFSENALSIEVGEAVRKCQQKRKMTINKTISYGALTQVWRWSSLLFSSIDLGECDICRMNARQRNLPGSLTISMANDVRWLQWQVIADGFVVGALGTILHPLLFHRPNRPVNVDHKVTHGL